MGAEPAKQAWLSPIWVRIFFFTIPLKIGVIVPHGLGHKTGGALSYEN